VGEEIVCGFKLVRELGARSLPAYAAIDPKPRRPEDALCVVDRLTRGEGVSAEGAAVFLRDGKRLAQLRHPNLVHVRDVVLGTGTMLLVSDWIEGEILADVQRLARAREVSIPLAGSLRIVTDLLEGLSALHELRDARQEPLSIVHAEIAPRNVVVGTDGRAVLVHPLRPKADVSREHAREVVGYLAPEVLLADQTADQRADVYGAGVLLWEALAGARMHPENEGTGEIVMRLLGGKIEAPSVPADAPWAAPLAEVTKRAVAPDPSVRFANATEMLAEVRRVVSGHVAPKLTVAALVEALSGDRIRAREEALGVPRSARLPSQSAWTTEAGATTPKAPSAANEDATPVVRVQAKLGLDAESPPLPSSSRPAPSSPRRAAPSWGRVKTPSSRPSIPKAAAVAVAGSRSAPPAPDEAVDVDVEMDPSPRGDPAPTYALHPGVQRRGSEDRVAVDPAPASALPRPETPMRQSRTEDVAALIASPPPQPSPTAATKKVRWTILVACAIGAATVLWVLLRSTEPARSDTDIAPAPSIPATALEPPAPTAAPPATGTATPHAGSEANPLDSPPSDRRARANPVLPSSPPLPTVSSPAPSPAPPPPPSSAAAPAASSTHPKKHVYDPMGI
jgi:serine/threonine protein kinase